MSVKIKLLAIVVLIALIVIFFPKQSGFFSGGTNGLSGGGRICNCIGYKVVVNGSGYSREETCFGIVGKCQDYY